MAKLNIILGLAAMTSLLPLQQAFSMPIEQVNVRIVDASGGTSAPLLNKMSGSMQIVAQQLLADKDTEAVRPAQTDYERLLSDIGDRVLTGYEMQSTRLDLGAVTDITLHICPWSGTIRNAEIDLEFSGVEPQTAQLLESRLPMLKQRLAATIDGASVDASDWAGGVLRKMVRQEVETSLPEFKAAVDLVQQDDKTIVQVVIYPVGQLVRNVRYELRSEAIPNILLTQLKYRYQSECDKLRGLPVAYMARCRDEIVERLAAQLAAEPDVRRYNLRPRITMTPGADLGLEIMLDSDEYKIWFEGYGDIGRDEDNLSGKAHIGKFISPRDEVFGEAEVILDDVQWNFGLGYAYNWSKSNLSYMRRMPIGDNVYKWEYTLGPKWRLRAEHFSGDDRNEYAVRYRIHEFLSAEYVYGGQEFYLRLIGNL